MKIKGWEKKRARIVDLIIDFERTIDRYEKGITINKLEEGLDLKLIAKNLRQSIKFRYEEINKINDKINELKKRTIDGKI